MSDAANPSAIHVDYVLVFSHDAPKIDQPTIEHEYEKLIAALEKVGLQAVGRPGSKAKKEILICVRCPDEIVKSEVTRERLSDWLHGVSSTRSDPRTPRDFAQQPISSSERLRLIHNLIVCPPSPSPVSQSPSGASVTPRSTLYPHLVSIFPPHDPAFNHAWLAEWAKPATSSTHQGPSQAGTPAEGLLSADSPALLRMRDHFGPAIALYFTFLRTYFFALLVPAGLGLVYRLLAFLPATSALRPAPFPPIYAVVLSIWSTVFVESWRIRERKLGVRWGTHRCQDVARVRAGFVANKQKRDEVTGDSVGDFPWWNRAARMGATSGAVVAAAIGLATLISTIYSIEVFINEVYDGPGKQYLSLLPTILFAGVVPQVIGIWQQTATELTKWENHVHEASHESSLTLKMFALNTLVSYGGLILTSYIYVPFGSIIVPLFMSYLRSKGWIEANKHTDAKIQGAFSVNSQRLENTLFALTTTTQAIGAFTEIGLPFILRLVSTYREKQQVKKAKKDDDFKDKKGDVVEQDEEDEKEFLQRIRREAELPEYSLFTEFAEMVIQFGYVTLWSVIWPLVPLMALINNFFELRGDAYKLTSYTRRPIPTRTNTIGPWLEALSTVAWLSALTGSSLIYLFRPVSLTANTPDSSTGVSLSIAPSYIFHSTFVANSSSPLSPTAQAFYHSRVHLSAAFPSEDRTPFSSVRRTLFSALLVALASEHGLRVVRILVQWALEKALWENSPEETSLRKSEWQLKRGYLDGLGLGVKDLGVERGDKVIRDIKRDMEESEGRSDFWKRGDKGKEEINRASKRD